MGIGNRAIAYLDAQDDSKPAFDSFRSQLDQVQQKFSGLSTWLTGAGVAAIGFFAYGMKSLIDRADEFAKMSQRAGGVSVEWLSGTAYAAKLAGVEVDTMQKSLEKLSQKLDQAKGAPTDTQTKLAQDQLARLGVDVQGVKNGTVGVSDAFDQISTKVRSSGDSFQKTGAMIDVMGKSAAEVIPLMNSDMERMRTEAAQLGAVMTTQFAHQAEQFNDSITTMHNAVDGLEIVLAEKYMPRLTAMARAMHDGAVQSGILMGSLRGLQAFLTGDDQTKNDKQLYDLVDQKLELEQKIAQIQNESGGHPGVMSDSLNAYKKSLADTNAQIKVTMGFRAQLAAEDKKRTEAEAAQAKALNGGGGIGAKVATTAFAEGPALQSQLMARSAAIIAQENALATMREQVLAKFHQQGLIGEQAYYEALRNVRQAQADAEIAALQKSIDAQQQIVANSITPQAKITAQTALTNLEAKRDALRDAASAKAAASYQDEALALQAYQDQISGTNSKLLQMQGFIEAAAVMQYTTQDRLLKQKIAANSGSNSPEMQQVLDTEALIKKQAQLQEVSQRASLAEQGLSAAESGINSQRTSWQVTDLQQMALQSTARDAAAVQLTAIYDKQLAIAQTLSGPAGDAAMASLATFKTTIDGIKASSDVLGNSLRSTFSDDFATFLDNGLTHAKTWHEAMTSMLTDIGNQMMHLANQEIAQSLMKSSFGDTLTSGAKGLLGLLSGSGGSGTFVPAVGADAMTQSLVDIGIGRAGGGPVGAGSLNRVNENGPELLSYGGSDYLMMGAGSGTVKPNAPTKAAQPPLTQNFYITTNDAQSFRQSQGQIMADAARMMQRARRYT